MSVPSHDIGTQSAGFTSNSLGHIHFDLAHVHISVIVRFGHFYGSQVQFIG